MPLFRRRTVEEKAEKAVGEEDKAEKELPVAGGEGGGGVSTEEELPEQEELEWCEEEVTSHNVVNNYYVSNGEVSMRVLEVDLDGMYDLEPVAPPCETLEALARLYRDLDREVKDSDIVVETTGDGLLCLVKREVALDLDVRTVDVATFVVDLITFCEDREIDKLIKVAKHYYDRFSEEKVRNLLKKIEKALVFRGGYGFCYAIKVRTEEEPTEATP